MKKKQILKHKFLFVLFFIGIFSSKYLITEANFINWAQAKTNISKSVSAKIFVKMFTEKELDFLNPIPEQISISSEAYSQYREKAASQIDLKKSLCAKFVNRLFLARFGQAIYGNAWDMQLNEKNQKYLELIYQLPEKRFSRENNLSLFSVEDRPKLYEEFYDLLDKEITPIGVLGFLYQFSPEREKLSKNKIVLPQSHVGFLAGRKEFYFQNISETPKLLREIIIEKYGMIHDFEEPFLASRVALEKILQPNEKYAYQDYLLEEHFKGNAEKLKHF